MQSSTEMNDQTVAEVAVESVVAAKMNTVSDKPVACKVTMISGKKKAARNVLTRMEALGKSEGPFSTLQRSVSERLKVKVWTRNYRHIHGICTGYIVAYDKHMNLVLHDVDELYRNPFREESERKEKKKRIRKKKKKCSNLPEVSSDVTVKTLDSLAASLTGTNLDSTALVARRNPTASGCVPSDRGASSWGKDDSIAPAVDDLSSPAEKVHDGEDSDYQIDELLRQMKELTNQLEELGSSSDNERDDPLKPAQIVSDNNISHVRNEKESDVQNSRHVGKQEYSDLRKKLDRELGGNRKGLKLPSSDSGREGHRRRVGGRESGESSVERHSNNEIYNKTTTSGKHTLQDPIRKNSASFHRLLNQKQLGENVEEKVNSSYASFSPGRSYSKTRADKASSTILNSRANKKEMVNVIEPLLTRHVNQLFVRGDNVVMIAIVVD